MATQNENMWLVDTNYAVNKSDLNEFNITSLIETPPPHMEFNEGHRIAIALYAVLMVFSATGNVYVFSSLLRLRKHGKLGRVKLLLFNLTIADLVVTFVMMPLEISRNATVSWHAGDFLCRLLSFFRVFGLYLSGFVLICICLDRYIAVIKPFAICHATQRNKKLLLVAWITSILCSLPQPFIFHVEPHPEFQGFEQCVSLNSFPSTGYELAYNLLCFCLMYALPMGTILYCYSCILYKIYGLASSPATTENINGGLRRSSETAIERAKSKTLKMTLLTVIAYFVSWTPSNVITLWYWFDQSSAIKVDPRVQKILVALACTNSCVNPLIYGYFHVGSRARMDSESTPFRQIPLIRLPGGGRDASNLSLHPLVRRQSGASTSLGASREMINRMLPSPCSLLSPIDRKFLCRCEMHVHSNSSAHLSLTPGALSPASSSCCGGGGIGGSKSSSLFCPFYGVPSFSPRESRSLLYLSAASFFSRDRYTQEERDQLAMMNNLVRSISYDYRMNRFFNEREKRVKTNSF